MRIIFILFLCIPILLKAQAHLGGKVTDAISNEPILFGPVVLLQNGKIVKRVETDLDGNYSFNNISPGIYDVESKYVGYISFKTNDYEVRADRSNILNIKIKEGLNSVCCSCTCYKVPLIEFDNTSTGFTVIAEDVRNMPIPK